LEVIAQAIENMEIDGKRHRRSDGVRDPCLVIPIRKRLWIGPENGEETGGLKKAGPRIKRIPKIGVAREFRGC
jgi:hypothetical protein